MHENFRSKGGGSLLENVPGGVKKAGQGTQSACRQTWQSLGLSRHGPCRLYSVDVCSKLADVASVWFNRIWR